MHAQVFAQQRHYLHRLLAYEDELAALIAWVLDRQSLNNGSASFSDSLYGLRRAPYSAEEGKSEMLSRGQQRLALLHLVRLQNLILHVSADQIMKVPLHNNFAFRALKAFPDMQCLQCKSMQQKEFQESVVARVGSQHLRA